MVGNRMAHSEEIPLSKKAKIDLFIENNSNTFLWFFLTFMSAGAIFLMVLAFLSSGGKWPLGILITLAALCLVFVFSLVKFRRTIGANKKKIAAQNAEDYKLSLAVLSISDSLKEKPPDLTSVDVTGLMELRQLTPIRVDYSSDSKINGEVAGTMRGFGFFAFRGEFSGKINGEAIPQLADQHAVVLCRDQAGQIYRLVFPNVKSTKKAMGHYFEELGKSYGWGSYVQLALYKVWSDSFLDVFARINFQHIIDQLAGDLELPAAERMKIDIKGIQVKEGLIFVSFIKGEGKESAAVIPTNFIKQTKDLLEGKLMKELPPMPMIEK